MSHHFLRFEHVCYTYPNGYEALHDVSFTIHHGEKVALLGNNGAGKSTLLLHTNGLLLPTAGRVNVGEVPVDRHTAGEVRRRVGMVFQNADDQLFMPTVEEDVAFGPLNMQLPPDEVERRIENALKTVGMEAFRRHPGYQLSGGQKRRVAIATVLAMEPDILVMDEPTADLDPDMRRQIIRLLVSFPHTCLIATHDMALAQELCPRTLWLREGRLAYDGLTETYFSQTDTS